jgi:kojibiose phosphorylase
MKSYYSQFSSENSWMIKAEGWVDSLQAVRESQLALGNGLLGSRAILEEIPYGAKPGTYIAGLYDKMGSQVAELVNLPNPFNFKIVLEGEKLGVVTMDVAQHRRILNLRQGLLLRHTVFQDSRKRLYDYQSLRFLSMHEKNIGVMQVIFTPLDEAVVATIQTGIDTSVHNTGTVTEGRKRHFRIKEVGQFNNEGYLVIETFGKTHSVIFRSGFYYQTRNRKVTARDNIFELRLRKNQTVIFTKIFYMEAVSKEDSLDKRKRSSERQFRKAFNGSYNSLLSRHMRVWDDLWRVAEVSIWGEPEVEKNFRFNIYHLLICAAENNGFSSIGARALSGEGYHGHIFWDAEIFLLPFYLFTLPQVARNMLLYRYKRLDAARAIARQHGFKGAMFPWESAGLGLDETPGWAKDLDGKVIKIHTGEMEQHITADVAYAFYYYNNVTRDEQFLKDYGYEVLFETARFWASRVEYNKRKRKYEIRQVIGPDEFHVNVDNNAFTNMMAKWNLLIACKMFNKMKETQPKAFKSLKQRIGLSDRESREWKKIASRMSIRMDKRKIIEQFEGYFKKKRVNITRWDEDSLPIVSQRLNPRDYAKTQLVKQADVIMLLYLLSDVFSFKTKKANYEYYIARTIHKSSLSLPMCALMAVELGDKNRGYQFFNSSLHTDISDIHNNTEEGIHAACIGGTWQVLIHGFAGIRIDKEILSINPRLPRIWRRVILNLRWRGGLLYLELKNNKIKIQFTAVEGRRKVKIKVFGVIRQLVANKAFSFERKIAPSKPQRYYL